MPSPSSAPTAPCRPAPRCSTLTKVALALLAALCWSGCKTTETKQAGELSRSRSNNSYYPFAQRAVLEAPVPGQYGHRARPAGDAAPLEQRSGLGTRHGEWRQSRVSDAQFDRATSRPTAVRSIAYNDAEGARERFGSSASRQRGFDVGPARVEFRRGNGWRLPAYSSRDGDYIVGDEGDRYAVRITNNDRRSRIEVVLSVDGLDAIDGRSASTSKRGYVIAPGETMTVEGWRTSNSGVAAFRFGSVEGSYAARSGAGTANVGVIGVAVFEESGRPSGREGDRRGRAQAFPGDGGEVGGRFSRPPGAPGLRVY